MTHHEIRPAAPLIPNAFFLRLDAGEVLHETIVRFCEEQGITAGHFTAIGAVRGLVLAYYHLDRKEYAQRECEGDLEVVSCTGNVALFEDRPFLHVHGVFSDADYRPYAGHVVRAEVSATLEVYLTPFYGGGIRREPDPATGLKLCIFGPPTTPKT